MTWLFIPEEVRLQNFKPIYSEILRIKLNLDYPGQVAFVMFGLVFMKFRKLKILWREKNVIFMSLSYFHCLSHPLYYWGNFFQNII